MDKLHTARVDSKGRVLLPAELREAHGFEPGTRVTFVEDDEDCLKLAKTLAPVLAARMQKAIDDDAGETRPIEEYTRERGVLIRERELDVSGNRDPSSFTEAIAQRRQPAGIPSEEALGVPNLSCWNYRVVRTEAPPDAAAKQNFALYEVFYNEAGEPDAFAEASPPMGASLEELADDLKAMQEALSQPVLEYAELVETCRRNAKPVDPNETTMSLEEFTASLGA
jgi:AbrB family looped-hinge helix DNA binding protein